MGDGSAPASFAAAREVGRRLEAAEEVRLLEEHRRGALGCLADAGRVGDTAVVRHLDDLEAEAERERPDDRAHLRVRRLGHDHRSRPVAALAR